MHGTSVSPSTMHVNVPPSGELIPSANGGPAPIVVSGWSKGENERSSRFDADLAARLDRHVGDVRPGRVGED